METRCFRVGSYIKDQLIQSFDFIEDKSQELEKLGLNHTGFLFLLFFEERSYAPNRLSQPGGVSHTAGPWSPHSMSKVGVQAQE